MQSPARNIWASTSMNCLVARIDCAKRMLSSPCDALAPAKGRQDRHGRHPAYLAQSCTSGPSPRSGLQVEKEKEALRLELNKAKQQMREADTAISAQNAELDKLNHIINEADQERIRQKKEYDIVINERDILGACPSEYQQYRSARPSIRAGCSGVAASPPTQGHALAYMRNPQSRHLEPWYLPTMVVCSVCKVSAAVGGVSSPGLRLSHQRERSRVGAHILRYQL